MLASNYAEQKKSYSTFMYGKEDVGLEVEKVTRRLPRWFRNKSQNNSRSLIAFLGLYTLNQHVDIDRLKGQCRSVKDFYGNYNQMKILEKKIMVKFSKKRMVL